MMKAVLCWAGVLCGGYFVLALIPDLYRDLRHPELWNDGMYNPITTGSCMAAGVGILILGLAGLMHDGHPLKGLAYTLSAVFLAVGAAVNSAMERSHPVSYTVEFTPFGQKQEPGGRDLLPATNHMPERKSK
jgi:hypothetical protein